MTEKFTFDQSLTILDIAPKWGERFRQLPIPKLSWKCLQWGLEITAAEMCIVGEAYGYSASYLQTCKECEMIGNNFQTNLITRSYENLNKNTKKFIKHWNEKHTSYSEPAFTFFNFLSKLIVLAPASHTPAELLILKLNRTSLKPSSNFTIK